MIKRQLKLFRQNGHNDCGQACILMMADFFGFQISNSYLVDTLHLKQFEELSLYQICEAAKKIGFSLSAVKTNLYTLKKEIRLPCILHWNQNHFVVLHKIKKNEFYIADPAVGFLKFNERGFCSQWTNNSDPDGTGILLYS